MFYEFECGCGVKEVRIPMSESGETRTCPDCKEVMVRKFSAPSLIVKANGRDMALATLNAREGSGLPNRPWRGTAERAAAAGL